MTAKFLPEGYEPLQGDLVNVTFQTRLGSSAYRDVIDNASVVERVQPADDPSKDPIGTVRRSTDGRVASLSDAPTTTPWRVVFGNEPGNWARLPHEDVVNWEKLAPVEGTPAALAALRVFVDEGGDKWCERTPGKFTVKYGATDSWSERFVDYSLERIEEEFGPLSEVKVP